MQLKPLKDITIREAAIWCHNARLPTMNSRGWGGVKGKDDGKRDARGKGGVASLEMLTERKRSKVGVWLISEFIAGLSVTHPSTVSTINRTGEKLVFPGDADKTLCPVCEQYVSGLTASHLAVSDISPVDPSALDWKKRTALMSLPTKDVEPTSALANVATSSLAPLLCYSCLTTFTPTRISKPGDEVEPVMLPLWVGQRVSTQDMRKKIGSFLLDQDEEAS
jgi:cytoplasmic tRNA 2-thiolation protein 2